MPVVMPIDKMSMLEIQDKPREELGGLSYSQVIVQNKKRFVEDIERTKRDLITAGSEASYVNPIKPDFNVLGTVLAPVEGDDGFTAWRDAYCIIDIGIPNHYYVIVQAFEVVNANYHDYELEVMQDTICELLVPKSRYIDALLSENVTGYDLGSRRFSNWGI